MFNVGICRPPPPPPSINDQSLNETRQTIRENQYFDTQRDDMHETSSKKHPQTDDAYWRLTRCPGSCPGYIVNIKTGSFKIATMEIPGGKRNLKMNINAQQIVLKFQIQNFRRKL
jgi:hypothetical protein